MKDKAKLKGKDLINIGIYAAIYCVIMTAVAMLGFIPIMMPLLCVIVPLIGGIPMMLFMTKVDKFGMVTIYAMIVGLFLWITGMGYWPFLFGVVFGFFGGFDRQKRRLQEQQEDRSVLRRVQLHDLRQFRTAVYQCGSVF